MFAKDKIERKVTPIRPAETDVETGLTPADLNPMPIGTLSAPSGSTTALPAKATDLLTQARDLVGGDRARQHGDMRKTHQLAADLWSAYFGFQVTPTDVAQCMSLLKKARSKNGEFNPEDFRDDCGYAAIAGELAEGRG